jgi:hypothetical protein
MPANCSLTVTHTCPVLVDWLALACCRCPSSFSALGMARCCILRSILTQARLFFWPGLLPRRNWAAGVAPEACSKGTEGHNTASIGGFVMLPPVILGSLRQVGGRIGCGCSQARY